MNILQLKNEIDIIFDTKITLYENCPSKFIELWPILGEKNLFGLLTQAKKNKDIQLLNLHDYIINKLARIKISGLTMSFLTQGWIIECLEKLTKNNLHNRVLEECKKGQSIAAFCLTEPNYGSDYSNLITKAEFLDNKWRINGEKIYITNGQHADYLIIVASTFHQNKKSISFFLAPKNTNGILIEDSVKLAGNKYAGISRIIFNNLKLDEENLLGNVGNGFFVLPKCLQFERLDIALYAVTAVKICLEETVNFLLYRKNQEIALTDIQLIQYKLANCYAKVSMINNYVQQAAYAFIEKGIVSKQILISKIYATEIALEVIQELIKLNGANGFRKNNYLNLIYNDLMPLTIGGGSNDVLRSALFNSLNISKKGKMVW